jgi:hypothetical protein
MSAAWVALVACAHSPLFWGWVACVLLLLIPQVTKALDS